MSSLWWACLQWDLQTKQTRNMKCSSFVFSVALKGLERCFVFASLSNWRWRYLLTCILCVKLIDLPRLCIKTWFLCKTWLSGHNPGGIVLPSASENHQFIRSWKLRASFKCDWHNYGSVSVHENRVSFSVVCLSAWGPAVTKPTLQEDSGAQSVTPARFSSKEKRTPRSSTAAKSGRTNQSLQTAGRSGTCWNHNAWAWHNNLLFL